MHKILVTGARGMLGQDLCPILEDEGYEVIETDIHNLDITNPDMVEDVLIKEKPDIVIHCAAYTNVDKAEEDLKTAEKINVKGTENIAKVCGEKEKSGGNRSRSQTENSENFRRSIRVQNRIESSFQGKTESRIESCFKSSFESCSGQSGGGKTETEENLCGPEKNCREARCSG